MDYDTVRYRLVPPLFLVVFTLLPQFLVKLANPDSQTSVFTLGSLFSWQIVATFYVWAYLSIKASSSALDQTDFPF